MTEWLEFAAAFVVFMGSHAIPARPAMRRRLSALLGERGYLWAYVAASLASLAWAIGAAGRAPHAPLWAAELWMLWVPALAMPVACLLVAFGVGAPNPLSFGGTHADRFDPERPGIAGAARHPLLWALALWSGAHVVLFGAFAACSLLGMAAIDRRLARRMGPEEWRRMAARTSAIPLAALVSGRWRPSERPSAARLALAALLWLGLLAAHPPVIGASPRPSRPTG